MKVELLRANIGDAKELHAMQIKAFKELLEKYQDFNISIIILPEFQGKGIAQKAIRLCEEKHGNENWELDTILQEPKTVIYMKKLNPIHFAYDGLKIQL